MCRKFEWDESKNQINLNKHGIDFDTASFVVAHTVQDVDNLEIIRIISARKAIPKEKKRYEQAAFR